MITDKDKNKIDDNWFPYDSSPSLSSKIIGTIILISIIFFLSYGIISFIHDIF